MHGTQQDELLMTAATEFKGKVWKGEEVDGNGHPPRNSPLLADRVVLGHSCPVAAGERQGLSVMGESECEVGCKQRGCWGAELGCLPSWSQWHCDVTFPHKLCSSTATNILPCIIVCVSPRM